MEISPTVTAAVLGAALLHAAWNALVRGSEDKELDSLAVWIGSATIALPLILILPPPAFASWLWLAGSVAVHVFYLVFIIAVYRAGELSHTYPIMRGGGAVLVAIFSAFFLDEVLPGLTIVGIALIIAGVFAFASRSHDSRATFLALGNAVVVGVYSLLDAQGARLSSDPFAYVLWLYFLNGVVGITLGWVSRGQAMFRYVAKYWGRASFGAVCSVAGYSIVLWAITQAPVAVVSVLRETSVIFAALIGTAVLGETFTRARVIGTGLVVVGLVTLKA